MMKIKKVAFGNGNEAYIESRFKENVNIIFSEGNNKGKTLLIQGLMYSMGNEPVFPSGFNFKDYHFYSLVQIQNSDYEFLRHGNSIIIRNEKFLQICNTISEFKHFFNKVIDPLPVIIKDSRHKIIDVHLLFELFFLGQDNRVPSNLIVKGQYNKNDFLSMIYSLNGIENKEPEKYDLKNEKEKLEILKQDKKNLLKKLKIAKQNTNVAGFTQKSIDKEQFNKKKLELEKINKSILDLKKDRNREFNRKVKLESLRFELSSLNINLNQGKTHCGECGSDKIIFTNDEFDFEISNKDVRLRIINSINENIEIKEEIIQEYDLQIQSEQDQFNKEIEVSSPDLGEYILFKDEIIDASSIDEEIHSKQISIDKATQIISSFSTTSSDNTKERLSLITEITDEMNRLYQIIDPNGNLTFNELFPKKDQTFSGSEGQEFYFCKLIALNSILKHNYPIINDSFRSGEISSDKERKMIEIYERLGKQVIISSTLKSEEYATDKYKNTSTINVIDYNIHSDSKILSHKFSSDFQTIIESFDISINKN
ncbi:hypothetical protein [Maribacter litoralis]|uniref:hypothetical protein n=1 Tax=Maribacter litoralis TaxID=2059726 RepID=UPI003D2B529A